MSRDDHYEEIYAAFSEETGNLDIKPIEELNEFEIYLVERLYYADKMIENLINENEF